MVKFICGDSFRDKAGIVLDNVYKGIDGQLDVPEAFKTHGWKHNDIIFYENSQGDPNVIFCRTDLLPMLVNEINLEGKTLISHNSDINVRVEHVDKVKAGKWFSQNVDCAPVIPIPLGIENKRFGKWQMITELRKENFKKTTHIYLNVHPASNPTQRIQCIEKGRSLGIPNDFKLSTDSYMVDQLRYMKELQKSYFVMCPEGAGIDTHRAFEALYMGAIPIVTESQLTIKLSTHFPFVILKSWDDLTPELLTEDFYHEMWDLPGMRENLDFETYWNKIK